VIINLEPWHLVLNHSDPYFYLILLLYTHLELINLHQVINP